MADEIMEAHRLRREGWEQRRTIESQAATIARLTAENERLRDADNLRELRNRLYDFLSERDLMDEFLAEEGKRIAALAAREKEGERGVVPSMPDALPGYPVGLAADFARKERGNG